MPVRIPINRERIVAFCRKWGITEFSLFGSVLRDDFRPDSDVDVLVSCAPDLPWSYWNWPETIDELQTLFGREVDLTIKEGLQNPFRRHEILRTREVVYAA